MEYLIRAELTVAETLERWPQTIIYRVIEKILLTLRKESEELCRES